MMDRSDVRAALGQFATGVTVVTTRNRRDGPHGMPLLDGTVARFLCRAMTHTRRAETT
jgi:flavin reductase (DIM6/NTAB) family NADH-FMN oxidoreductase RutF